MQVKLIYQQEVIPKTEMTLKVVGHQWYWSYEYPDYDGLTFDAMMVADEDLEEGQLRLLTTDNALVIPTNTNIKMQITSDPAGVIHSWAVPSLGVKTDGIPGRLNETYFNVEEPGMYYGQCSELCGPGHGFMPIMVRAVSPEEFASWLESAKEEFASNKDKQFVLK